jgi:hypothetical protein
MLRALFLAVSVSAAGSAADIPLLPPPEIGPAATYVTAAAVGNVFLAAWGSGNGVCARRVGSAGTIIDDPPLCFALPSPSVRGLTVVGVDDHWTLFWVDDAGFRAARIALDGRLLDAGPKQLEGSQWIFGVARDGDGFVVVRGDGRVSLVDGGLTTLRDIGNTGDRFGHQAEAAASSQGYLAAVDDHLTFFDTAGRVLAQTTIPGGANGRHIASAGGTYLVAWVPLHSVDSISMAVFDTAGNAIAAPRTITPPHQGRYLETFAVIPDGAGYTLVDAELDQNPPNSVQHFRGFRFAANGAQIETFVTPDISAGPFQPLYFVMGLARGSGGYFLVTVSNPRSYAQGWAFGSLAAIPAAPQIASFDVQLHGVTATAIAAAEDGFVAAWIEDVPPPSDGPRSDGIVHFSVVGGASMELDRGSLSAPLALASGGHSSLVAWSTSTAVRVRLLRRDGTSHDLTIPVRAFVKTLTAAWCGSAYVVAWSDVYDGAYAVAITPEGGARDAQLLGTAPRDAFFFNRPPSSACNENGCLFAAIMGRVTSIYNPPYPYALTTVRFDRNGNAVAPMHFLDIPADNLGFRPFFDGSGRAYVVYGRAADPPIDGLAVAAVNNDGSIAGGGTQITFAPHDYPLLATELGFYSIHDYGRLYWTSLTLTPPAITGQVDLGESKDIVAVAVRGSSVMALVQHGASLTAREIPPPPPRRHRAVGSR